MRSAFLIICLSLAACVPDDAPPGGAPLSLASYLPDAPPPTGWSPARVNAVMVKGSEPSARTWCDVYLAPGNGPKLTLPPATAARIGSDPTAMPKDRWVWLNFWATWCGPCLREMPLIDRWAQSLRNQGAPLDLWYISVDENAAELGQFLATRPSTASGMSLRLLQPTALGDWLAPFGLPRDTAIPINVLLGPGGELRCVRTGSIAESDFSIIQGLVNGR